MKYDLVDIILASRDRPESLARFLDSLRELDLQGVRVRLIVVDNGEKYRVSDAVGEKIDGMEVRVLRVANSSKCYCLNRALELAEAEILLFTDDDVLLDERLIRAYLEAFSRHPQAVIFGGRVEVPDHLLPDWVRDSFRLKEILATEHHQGNEEKTYPAGKYPAGPNLAARASVLAGMKDPWSDEFGPGSRIPVGDEAAFVIRVLAHTPGEVIYVPDAVVTHLPDFTGFNSVGALKRCFWGGTAAGILRPEKTAAADKTAGNALEVLLNCRSVREFLCTGAKALGVMWGRINKNYHGT